MPLDLSRTLVVGISSRALFDLEEENKIYEEEGLMPYSRYQIEHEGEVLNPGTAFPLVEALLKLNEGHEERVVEVVVMSRNSPDTGLRIFNSLDHYSLDITRTALTGGEPLAPYLKAFHVDLFLSKDAGDVQAAVDAGVAAAHVYHPPPGFKPDTEKVRIAFDYDGVLVSEESEKIYQREGLKAFLKHERNNADRPLPEGPFAKLLTTISQLQRNADPADRPVRVAVVTARNRPAHERVIRTLRAWDVQVDSAFFMGGIPKNEVLKAFRAHIFFDDQEVHIGLASAVVPSATVPYRTSSIANADFAAGTAPRQSAPRANEKG